MFERIRASLPLIASRFADVPGAEAEVRSAIGQTLFELGEYDMAREQFERTVKLVMEHDGPTSRDALRERSRLIELIRWQYHPDEAKKLCDVLLADALKTYPKDDLDVLPILSNAAGIEADLEHDDAAVAAYHEVIALRTRVEGTQSDGTLTAKNNLANVLMNLGRYDEADALLRDVVAGNERKYGPDSSTLIVPHFNLAQNLAWEGKHSEALPLLEQNLKDSLAILGPTHDHALLVRRAIAESMAALGRDAEALALYDSLIEQSKKLLGPEHESTLRAMNSRGIVLSQMGRYDESIAAYREVLPAMQRAGSNEVTKLATRRNLAIALGESGKHDESLAELNAILIDQQKVAPNGYGMFSTLNSLAYEYLEAKQLSEAEPLFHRAIDGFKLQNATRETGASLRGLGRTLTEMGRYDEAEQTLKQAQEFLKNEVDPRVGRKTAKAFVTLYEASNKPDQAAAWRLQAADPTNAPSAAQPASTQPTS